MDLAVDTSSIIAVITNEPTKSALIAHTVGARLIAPLSVHWEIGNAFSAMLKRKRITLAEAQQALAAYRQIPIRFVDVDLERALALSDRFDIYAYDAYIIEVALDCQCALLALDGGLLHAAKAAGVATVEVTP
jgi:predicted nucleic acid-binding protein